MKLAEIRLSKIEMDIFLKIEEEIVQSSARPNVIYIEGGHFDPRKKIGSFSKNSLRFSLNIANNLILKYKRDIKVVLGVLVNNIGIDCGKDACVIGTNSPENTHSAKTLPIELQEILNEYIIYKEDKLIVSNEINLKNRGVRTLRKNMEFLLNEKCIELDKNGDRSKIYHNADDEVFLLAETDMDKWKAKCPTIMGQHYADLFLKLNQRYPSDESYILVDFSEIFDRHKVGCGKKACFNIFMNSKLHSNRNRILNVFQWDNSGARYNLEM